MSLLVGQNTQVARLINTSVPQGEGQHLQDVSRARISDLLAYAHLLGTHSQVALAGIGSSLGSLSHSVLRLMMTRVDLGCKGVSKGVQHWGDAALRVQQRGSFDRAEPPLHQHIGCPALQIM